MPQNYSALIIADTSCLIALTNIELLDILKKMCSTVVVTPEIAGEYGEPLPDWIKIEAVKNTPILETIQHDLDRGESSAIALAMETEDALLILDEKKARSYAKRHNLTHTGTIGLLLDAYQEHLLEDIETIIDKLHNIGFRMPSGIDAFIKSDRRFP
jgi:predicted nucleic acid-binding protein